MTIHVNIGEAGGRLSDLVAAALRGEEVVLREGGKAAVRLEPLGNPDEADLDQIARRRRAAFGMFREAFEGHDVSLEALKADRPDPDERELRALGPDL